MNKIFTTKRLLLNEITLSDAEFIYELVNTEAWKHFIGDRNIQNTTDAIAYIQKLIDDPCITYFVVRSKEDQCPAGVISFIKREHLEHSDIGFAFLPAHSGKGYAYEAASAVLEEAIGFHPSVCAITMPENKSSIRLLERLGFSFKSTVIKDGEELVLYIISADKVEIDKLVRSFFGIFTNTNGKQPDWTMIDKTCIPETLIIKKADETSVYTLDSFSAPRKKILTDGTLTDFEEYETSNETKIITNIAQRHSRYEKKGVLNGKQFRGRGNKFFQFIKTTEGWKISAVVWEDEAV